MKGADFMRGGELVVEATSAPFGVPSPAEAGPCPLSAYVGTPQATDGLRLRGGQQSHREAGEGPSVSPSLLPFFLHSPSFFFIFSASEVERRHSIARTHEPPPPLSPRRPRGRQT